MDAMTAHPDAATTSRRPETWLSVLALGLLGVVLATMWIGVGTHPTIHRLVMFWGMVGFTTLALGLFLNSLIAERLWAKAAHAWSWWSWARGVMAVAALAWVAVQLASNIIGRQYCVSVLSDMSVCGPQPAQLWMAAAVAASAAVLALWLMVVANARSVRAHHSLAYVTTVAALPATLFPVGLALLLIALAARGFAYTVPGWVFIAGSVAIVAIVEFVSVRELRSHAVRGRG